MHPDHWEICPSTRRRRASLNDLGIWIALTLSIWLFIWGNSFGVGSVTPSWAPFSILSISLALIFVELMLGNSIGKYAVAIRVLNSDGQTPARRQLITRLVGKYLPCASIITLLVLLDSNPRKAFPTLPYQIFNYLLALAWCVQALSLITWLVGPR